MITSTQKDLLRAYMAAYREHKARMETANTDAQSKDCWEQCRSYEIDYLNRERIIRQREEQKAKEGKG